MSWRRPTLLGMAIVIMQLNYAHARDLGVITSGSESSENSEEQKSHYYINCIAKADNVTLLAEPDINKPYRESTDSLQIHKGDELRVKKFVTIEGRQFLAGQILRNGHGKVWSLDKEGSDETDEDRDTFYVQPKDWDCRLLQGSYSVDSSTCKMYLRSWLALQCKYENICPTGNK